MKTLNSVQELWSKLLFCPNCQDITRSVSLSIGPPDALRVIRFRKADHILKIHCEFNLSEKEYTIKYDINCLDNSLSYNISYPEFAAGEKKRVKSPFFYLQLHANCKCMLSYADSRDLEIDFIDHKITNIGVARESVWLLEQNPKYHITLLYPEDQMLISRCHEDDYDNIVDDTNPYAFPLMPLDFSKPQKVVNKLQTLLLFS